MFSGVGGHEGVGHGKHGGRDALREAVVALCHAAGDVQVDHLVGPLGMAFDQFAHEGAPAGLVQRRVDADLGQAALEAGQVLGQAEGVTFVDGDDIIDAVTEDEAPVEHRDARFGQRQVFTIEIDGLFFGHGVLPVGKRKG